MHQVSKEQGILEESGEVSAYVIQAFDADREDEDERQKKRLSLLFGLHLKEEKAQQDEKIRLHGLVAENGVPGGQAAFLESRGKGIGQIIIVQGVALGTGHG